MAGFLRSMTVSGLPLLDLHLPQAEDRQDVHHTWWRMGLTKGIGFDEGIFANDVAGATEEVIYTLSVLDDVHPIVSPDDNPLRHTLQSCWMRFKKRSSVTMQYRWKRYLTVYCIGVLRQIGFQHRASLPNIKQYMDIRAGSVGVYPCIGLME
jgi:hypothetical protein